MCVCALQTKEQKNFTFDEINNMMLTNPHGAGLMWNDGKSIKYRKGYFDAKKFYDDYVAIRALPTTREIAVHARIGTGSNIDIANCHPFPITSVNKRLKAKQGSCDVGVMMNGIIGASTKLDFKSANKQNHYTATPITINTIFIIFSLLINIA